MRIYTLPLTMSIFNASCSNFRGKPCIPSLKYFVRQPSGHESKNIDTNSEYVLLRNNKAYSPLKSNFIVIIRFSGRGSKALVIEIRDRIVRTTSFFVNSLLPIVDVDFSSCPFLIFRVLVVVNPTECPRSNFNLRVQLIRNDSVDKRRHHRMMHCAHTFQVIGQLFSFSLTLNKCRRILSEHTPSQLQEKLMKMWLNQSHNNNWLPTNHTIIL